MFSTRPDIKIGLIGLGNMGSEIAKKLSESGYTIFAYDVDRSKMDPLSEQEVISPCSSSREVAERSDVIITLVPASEHIRAVFEGENGLLSGLSAGKTVLEMSTIDVKSIFFKNRNSL